MTTTTETKTSYTSTDILPKTFGLYILTVSEWEQAIAFYRDTLGWELRINEPNAWAEFSTNGITFAIHPPKEGETPTGIDTHLSFYVQNVDTTIAALKEKGVTITSEPVTVCENTRCASFVDPFGNAFHITGA